MHSLYLDSGNVFLHVDVHGKMRVLLGSFILTLFTAPRYEREIKKRAALTARKFGVVVFCCRLGTPSASVGSREKNHNPPRYLKIKGKKGNFYSNASGYEIVCQNATRWNAILFPHCVASRSHF